MSPANTRAISSPHV
jgi:hypothetical protein